MCGKILYTSQFGIIMCIKKVFASVHKQINKSESINNYLPGSNRKYGNNLQVQKNTVLCMLAPRLAGPNRMLQGSQIPAVTINKNKYICVSVSGSRPPMSMPGPGGRGLSGASAALLPVRPARNQFGRLARGGVDQSSFSITRRPWRRRIGALVSGGGGWNKEDGQTGGNESATSISI
jgi:hypothetical protein